MRIAIISDCHFGFNGDALTQARVAMQMALERKVDAILLPGDIYDVRVPKQEVLHETISLYSEIKERGAQFPTELEMHELKAGKAVKLKNSGIPLLAIWGTHERRSKGLTNVIQIMDAAGLLTCFHARTIILGKGNEKIAIQGIGGVPEEYFGRTLKVADFRPVPGAYNIFVFHQNLAELLPVETDETVSLEELPAGFDIYVNGHIHWNHDLSIKGRRLLVAGSTVVTQMKKSEEKPKGFYILETLDGKAQFVQIPSRPFFFRELEFDGASASKIDAAIEGEIAAIVKEAHLLAPVIRIKLTGTVEKSALAMASIERIAAKYSGNAQIYIDRDFESAGLKERIEILRRMRTEGMGVRELGWEILRGRLKEKSLKISDAHELFELLAEGEIEKAVGLL
ncbi:MAG: metallophosphoesterase [Candidatus Micrarchaeota archaeon]